ncbi:MAG: alpha/beta hydrolase [Chloroflexota bacterium]
MRDYTLDINGLRLHTYEAGSGSPSIVFIHGWASSGRTWQSSMERVAPYFRCLAPDLPGHGHSDKPPFSWYRLAAFVENVSSLLDVTRAHPASVVGHSMGGTIAIELARRRPEAVTRLVLVNPVVTGRLTLDLRWISGRLPRRLALALARRMWPPSAARLRRSLERNGGRLPAGSYQRRDLEDLLQATADSLLGSARAVIRHDASPHLPALRAPTLILLGARDRTVPPREGRLAARAIAGSRLVELPVGHLPFDEAPVEFLDHLERFLLE